MVGGYWKGIVISVLLIGSVIYFAYGKKNVYDDDKIIEMLLKAEDQICKTDKRIPFIRQELPDNSHIKCSYTSIIVAMNGRYSMVKLQDAEIENVFEKFQLHMNEYETDELFKDVRDSAEKLKKHREYVCQVELFQTTIEHNNCDLEKLDSININELQTLCDKCSFHSSFLSVLEKLRNLNVMKKDSSIKSREALEKMETNFNEGLTESELDEFKEKSIKALSEFVVRIKNELQRDQTVATNCLNKNVLKKNPDELVLKFRIATVKVFQKITDGYEKPAERM